MAGIDQARRQIAASLGELREIARGIHPAVVSGHGLAVGLEQLAARAPVQVELRVEIEGRLPEALEVAAYYVVAESLTNIAKHAHAKTARVAVIRQGNDELVLEIVDDGIGGADSERGNGASRPRGPRRGPERPPPRLDPTRRRNPSEGGDSMRVAIAEDSVLLREGLARLLDEAGFEVVAQCENADDLLLKVRSFPPDVAIVDIRLPPTHSDEEHGAALRAPFESSGGSACSSSRSTSRWGSR